MSFDFRLRGCHPLWPAFPDHSTNLRSPTLWSCNPRLSFRITWFRLFRVRSPLLAESLLFSLPPGTEMVHFPGFASLSLYIQKRIMHVRMHWVSPFGNLRITAC